MTSPARVPRLELSLCLGDEEEERSNTYKVATLKHSDRILNVHMFGSLKHSSVKTDRESSYQGSPLSQSSSRRIKPFPAKIKSLTIATDVPETNEVERQDAETPLTHTLFTHDSRIAGRYNQPGGSLRVSFLQTEDGVCSFVQSDLAVDGDRDDGKASTPTPRSVVGDKEVPLLRRSVLGIIKGAIRALLCGHRGNHKRVTPAKR